jgi:hypothetical protein
MKSSRSYKPRLKRPTYRLGTKRQHSPQGVLAVCAITASLFVGALAVWLNEVPTYLASDPRYLSFIHIISGNEQAVTGSLPDERSNASSSSSPTASGARSGTPSLTHQNIITTVFWAGEPADSDNGYITNTASAWDSHWQANYGGVDAPTGRNDYLPGGFTPRENPFYVALPYNDITNGGSRKTTATNCMFVGTAKASWCKNNWIMIKKGNRVAYAQWEDAGPFGEDDVAYVFGLAAPHNVSGAHAGLDVSPAVRDFLSLQDVDHTDWSFVPASSVPAGPWKQIITTSRGDNLAN